MHFFVHRFSTGPLLLTGLVRMERVWYGAGRDMPVGGEEKKMSLGNLLPMIGIHFSNLFLPSRIVLFWSQPSFVIFFSRCLHYSWRAPGGSVSTCVAHVQAAPGLWVPRVPEGTQLWLSVHCSRGPRWAATARQGAVQPRTA